jgi:hypothetical protein
LPQDLCIGVSAVGVVDQLIGEIDHAGAGPLVLFVGVQVDAVQPSKGLHQAGAVHRGGPLWDQVVREL